MSIPERIEIAASLSRIAAQAYTAGSQRQILYTAAWLLREFHTEKELAEWIGKYVVGEMLPHNAMLLIDEAQKVHGG